MESVSEIKAGFIEYLNNKYGDDDSSKNLSDDIDFNIFSYGSDFKRYLVQNGYADASVFTQSVSELEKIYLGEDPEENYSTGNLQTAQTAAAENVSANSSSLDYENINTDDNTSVNPIDAVVDGITTFFDTLGEIVQTNLTKCLSMFSDAALTSNQSELSLVEQQPVDDVLDTIYTSEEALSYLDLDGDGEINDFEKELFEGYVQKDKDELTSEDLLEAFESIKNGTFKYDIELPKNAQSVSDIPETVAAQSGQTTENISARQTSDPTKTLTSTGKSYSSSGSSLVSAPSSAPTDINQMNLDQLKKEQVKRQENVDTAQSSVDTILSDIENIEAGEYQNAKNAYNEAVENDENISAELNERRTSNLEEIDSVNSEISSLNSQISQTEISLNQANNKLDSDNKTLSSLKSALSSYEGVSSEDSDEQAQIEQKKRELQAQINELENKTIPADEKECERLDNLLNGNDETGGLKAQLQSKQEQFELLQEQKAEIEEEILETCKDNPNSPTKKALEEFQAVELKLEELRAKLPDAQSDLAQALEDLNEVNELINTKEAQETKTENEYYTGSLPQELVEALDTKLGEGFCAKLEQVAKNINCDPADLIGMMQSESGINPSAYNSNGGAIGLIQFMPATARSLGTSTQELLNMSAIEQLDYVEQYFSNWTKGSDEKLTGGDLYTLCFLPAYLDREVLCSSSDSSTSKYYRANSVLDTDNDGSVTKAELNQRVENKYLEVLNKYGISA